MRMCVYTHIHYEVITCLSQKSHFETCSVLKQTSIIEVLRFLIMDLFNMVIAGDKSKSPKMIKHSSLEILHSLSAV